MYVCMLSMYNIQKATVNMMSNQAKEDMYTKSVLLGVMWYM